MSPWKVRSRYELGDIGIQDIASLRVHHADIGWKRRQSEFFSHPIDWTDMGRVRKGLSQFEDGNEQAGRG